MWHRLDVVLTDVSEERIASIFRVEDKKSTSVPPEQVQQTASSQVNTAVYENRSVAT
jgi:hypothetical protein